MATANDVIAGAFGNLALYDPLDAISAEDAARALIRLNDYLNGLNAKGCVFENVALTLTDTVPVQDIHLGDLKWALAKDMASQWGKLLQGQDLIDARVAERRFVANHTKLLPATADSGLLYMPLSRRYGRVL